MNERLKIGDLVKVMGGIRGICMLAGEIGMVVAYSYPKYRIRIISKGSENILRRTYRVDLTEVEKIDK